MARPISAQRGFRAIDSGIVRVQLRAAKTAAAGFRMSLTASDFRKAMGCFATGVTVITVDQDGEVHGMTANAFTAVSLDPVLVLVCVDHRARTHAHLHARKRFGVNVLRSDQQAISEYYARSAETQSASGSRGRPLRSHRARHACAARSSGVPRVPPALDADRGRPHHLHRGSGRGRGPGWRATAVFPQPVPGNCRGRGQIAEVKPEVTAFFQLCNLTSNL
jgi:hypothetical protein